MSNDFSKAETQLFKFDADLGIAFGFAIVCKNNGEDYYDTQGDHIPEESMLAAAADFMLNSRVGKTMHTGAQTGDVVFAFPLTAEIAKAQGIETDRTGLLIGFKPSDPDTLAKLKNGEFTGFSIGGTRGEDEVVE